MAKGIIIIDVPESCDECPVVFRHEEERCCRITSRNSFTTKPDWCPIKLLPEKKMYNTVGYYKNCEDGLGGMLIDALEVDVWNECIDEILGE